MEREIITIRRELALFSKQPVKYVFTPDPLEEALHSPTSRRGRMRKKYARFTLRL